MHIARTYLNAVVKLLLTDGRAVGVLQIEVAQNAAKLRAAELAPLAVTEPASISFPLQRCPCPSFSECVSRAQMDGSKDESKKLPQKSEAASEGLCCFPALAVVSSFWRYKNKGTKSDMRTFKERILFSKTAFYCFRLSQAEPHSISEQYFFLQCEKIDKRKYTDSLCKQSSEMRFPPRSLTMAALRATWTIK